VAEIEIEKEKSDSEMDESFISLDSPRQIESSVDKMSKIGIKQPDKKGSL